MSESSRAGNLHQNEEERPLQTKKQKRPPLTHFLCLPLISNTSLPLLEKSLNRFKHNIPPVRRNPDDHPRKPRPQLFPDSAVRPLGTLHLTLGVMSLPTLERVDEATELLQSLDVDKIMREVESELANNKDQTEQEQISTAQSPSPISVSLQSLDSLPRAKAATVLYAKPVDPTSRLHPFAVKIRSEFIKAGFIEQDIVKPRPKKHKNQKSQTMEKAPEGNSNENANDVGTTVAAESEEERLSQRKPKFRPLLLHATLVNTIYAHGRSQNLRRGRNKHGPFTFDARDILAHYRDFYADDTCTHEKQLPADDGFGSDTYLDNAGDDDSASLSSEEEAHPSKTVHQLPARHSEESGSQTQMPKYPFIWAENVPIDRLCICEMGAKKPTGNSDALATRLGQEYYVVAEKQLL